MLRPEATTYARRTMIGRWAALAAGAGTAGLVLGRGSTPAAAQATPGPVPTVVERWAAAWNARDAAAMAALFTDDGLYEDMAFEASFRGKAGVAEWVSITASAVPDAAVDLVAAYQAGDRATAEWIFSGTPIPAAGADEPASDGRFSVRAASVFELDGDRIRRVTDYYNPTTLRSQTGQATGAATAAMAAATPVALQANKELWQPWAALWNGDLSLADAIIAPNFVAHFAPVGTSPAEVRGPDGLTEWIGGALAAFDDYTFATEVGPLADGDLVAGRWLFQGTYRGGIPGAPESAVGTRVEYAGADIFRVEEGKIAEYWLSADSVVLLQQIGTIPS